MLTSFNVLFQVLDPLIWVVEQTHPVCGRLEGLGVGVPWELCDGIGSGQGRSHIGSARGGHNDSRINLLQGMMVRLCEESYVFNLQ
jgi:hypothetical protein